MPNSPPDPHGNIRPLTQPRPSTLSGAPGKTKVEVEAPSTLPQTSSALALDDRTQAYSRDDLQQLIDKSKSDRPPPDELTRQYTAEDRDRAWSNACYVSDLPPPNKSPVAAAAPSGRVPVAVANRADTIVDTDELTRAYVRTSGRDAIALSASSADSASHPVVATPSANGQATIGGASVEITKIRAKSRSPELSAGASRVYRVFVCVAIAVNVLLWSAYVLEQTMPDRMPAWWKSWRIDLWYQP